MTIKKKDKKKNHILAIVATGAGVVSGHVERLLYDGFKRLVVSLYRNISAICPLMEFLQPEDHR